MNPDLTRLVDLRLAVEIARSAIRIGKTQEALAALDAAAQGCPLPASLRPVVAAPPPPPPRPATVVRLSREALLGLACS